MRRSYLKMPPAAFKAVLGLSSVSTTVGYSATAWIIVAGALAAANH